MKQRWIHCLLACGFVTLYQLQFLALGLAGCDEGESTEAATESAFIQTCAETRAQFDKLGHKEKNEIELRKLRALSSTYTELRLARSSRRVQQNDCSPL